MENIVQAFFEGTTLWGPKAAGYEGVVVTIDLRYTKLDSEGDKILIPDSKLFTDPITVL